MTASSNWNKAVGISTCVHLLLVAVIASAIYWGPSTAPPKEEFLELDLTTFHTAPASASSHAAQIPPSQPQPTTDPQPLNPTAPTPSYTPTAPPVPSSSPTPATPTPAAPSSNSGGAPSEAPAAPKASGVIARPVLLSQPELEYPPDARAGNISGSVEVSVQILANGEVGEVSVIRSSGHSSLDQAAINNIRQYSFAPARDTGSGEPVACRIKRTLTFNLQDE